MVYAPQSAEHVPWLQWLRMHLQIVRVEAAAYSSSFTSLLPIVFIGVQVVTDRKVLGSKFELLAPTTRAARGTVFVIHRVGGESDSSRTRRPRRRI